MDNFLEINDERQSEAPSSDFSSSEIPSGSSKTKRKQKNKSTSAVKKPKTAAAPKEQWRTIHGDWLEYRNVNGKILMFCTWCEKAGYKNQMAKGCGTYKKDLIDRHVKNQEHTFLENSRKKNQPSIVQSLSQNLANDKEKVISQMKCVYFIAKNHLSLNLYPELCNLVLNPNKNFETPCLLQLPPLSSSKPSINNTPQYGSYQNSKYARKFEEAIFYVIEKALIDEIKASGKWSILIDESTTITDEKHLVLVSKHIANNVPVLRYLGLIELDDCSADNITTQIKKFLNEKDLQIKNIAHFGSDGASVMTGNINGVATQLKKETPFMTSVHCIAHRLHLAGQDAAKEVTYFKEYEVICKQLYGYFSSSYKRMQNLKLMQDVNEDPQLTILNIINTRWLSMSNVVHNLHQIIFSVIDALNDDMNNAENPKERDRTSQLISSLDPNFIISTMFLADLMYILTKMIKMFQRDHIDLSELKHSLETTISAIKAQFIGTEEVSPTYGTILHQYMDDNKILPDNLPSFISKFAKAIIESLKNRFPDSEIYNALRIFDPKFLPQRESDIANYGNNEIKILIEYFGNDRLSATGEKFSAYVNETELKQEWGIVKQIMKSIHNFDFVKGWEHIWNTKPHFISDYPLVSKLVKLALLIPLSNAHVERVFSHHKLTKTKLRNRMNYDTLNMHLMIFSNGPDDFRNFDWDCAYNYWANQHIRRANE